MVLWSSRNRKQKRRRQPAYGFEQTTSRLRILSRRDPFWWNHRYLSHIRRCSESVVLPLTGEFTYRGRRIRIIIGQPESKHDTERYGNGDNRSDRPKPPPRSLCFRHDKLCELGVSQHVLRSDLNTYSGIEGPNSRAQATIACLCQRSGDVCVSMEEPVKLTVMELITETRKRTPGALTRVE